MTVVYVDILFLINFSVDYIVLYLSMKMLHLRTTKLRMISVSVLMSFYGIWALLYCRSYLLLVVTALLSSGVACEVVFRPRGARKMVQVLVVYYGISAAMGGVTTLLSGIIGRFASGDEGNLSADYKIIVFTVITLLSTVFIYVGNRLLQHRSGAEYVNATICFQKKREDLILQVDSGNHVTDPFSGKRVVFVSRDIVERLCGISWTDAKHLDTRRRVICVNTVAGKRVLPAFNIDKLIVKQNAYECMIAVNTEMEFVNCDGIVPSALLK